jgi:hypothetical protein
MIYVRRTAPEANFQAALTARRYSLRQFPLSEMRGLVFFSNIGRANRGTTRRRLIKRLINVLTILFELLIIPS